jgi:hypothetical protein
MCSSNFTWNWSSHLPCVWFCEKSCGHLNCNRVSTCWSNKCKPLKSATIKNECSQGKGFILNTIRQELWSFFFLIFNCSIHLPDCFQQYDWASGQTTHQHKFPNSCNTAVMQIYRISLVACWFLSSPSLYWSGEQGKGIITLDSILRMSGTVYATQLSHPGFCQAFSRISLRVWRSL